MVAVGFYEFDDTINQPTPERRYTRAPGFERTSTIVMNTRAVIVDCLTNNPANNHLKGGAVVAAAALQKTRAYFLFGVLPIWQNKAVIGADLLKRSSRSGAGSANLFC